MKMAIQPQFTATHSYSIALAVADGIHRYNGTDLRVRLNFVYNEQRKW